MINSYIFQDWDFPHFMSAIDIKLPGVNTAHIRFSIPKCLRKESWNVHITGIDLGFFHICVKYLSKKCLRGFRPGQTQTGLCSHRRLGNFGFRKF